ncbi:uncharacterized protein [Triticum aestivum]|uniref:uncharacterized protein isoform X2 n=1 Tax=Triticum aestivum TaxID=4565 RepID=UPI001D0078C1|nr:uncharacterized protein LOC123173430 isoform X2 [Triticum aestivum]XP_044446667.1 uncharacterized protein LOC123176615 isoform X2 [Triticum aestivum]
MACELPISQRAAPPKPSPAPIAVLPKGLPPSYAAQIPARSGWTGHGRYRHQPPPPGALCGVRGAAPPSHDPLSSLPWCKWCGEARAPSTEILPMGCEFGLRRGRCSFRHRAACPHCRLHPVRLCCVLRWVGIPLPAGPWPCGADVVDHSNADTARDVYWAEAL